MAGPRAGFRGPVGNFQRPAYNMAARPRFNGYSRITGANFGANRPMYNSNTATLYANRAFHAGRTNFSANHATFNGNRTAINHNSNFNRFNSNTRGFANNWHNGNSFGVNGHHNWNGWGHHHHHDDNFIFFGGFGLFPFFSPWDYGYYYPSAYYPYYPYTPYSYDPYMYYGSGAPVYGDGGYIDNGNYNGDPNYDNQAGDQGDQHYDQGSGQNDSVVAQVQEQLAHNGYYKGSIDGVEGSRTYYAIRSYQRDHHLAVTGRINDELLGALGVR